MNEAETRAEHIDPALKAAGWGVVEGSRILREYKITLGRIEGKGRRGRPEIADYVLVYRNIKLAVNEAKAWDKAVTEGVAQAKAYAEKLQILFTFATNGQSIYGIDMETGVEGEVARYPTPEELWNLTFAKQDRWRDYFAAIPFEDRSGYFQGRYYQDIAIERVLAAIAAGDFRILLTLATGTGKTFIAFQIAWKLFQSRWNLSGEPTRRPRILFLADRNILANQAFNAFSAFEDTAPGSCVRIRPDEIRRTGKLPTNGSIFFTIFQTFMSGPPKDGQPSPYFGEYPPDFFDFIIIDECHRGGANDESRWREILEYFAPAVQLGLTATPKRKDNVDTYAYFGEPVFIYSLKEGINDGFLTPFRVKQIQTTLDSYRWTSDDAVLEGEIDAGKMYDESDFNRSIEIREREKKRAEVFLAQINPNEKTLVFCANQIHALLVCDLINQLKTSSDPNYCVRVTADDGERGEQWLRDFQDNEKTIPTILTTSQKLSTGVDARNVRNIVLMRPVNSMIEFKQIIGRGTRLYDGKDYFTIYDFVKAHLHFSDPEWDGEPVEEEPCPKCGNRPCSCVVTPPKPCDVCGKSSCDCPKEPCEICGKVQCTCQKRKKAKVKLADGKERSIQHMMMTTFWHPDGTPMSAQQFMEMLFGKLPDFFANEDELRELWSSPATRAKLLEGLEERGFGHDQLAEMQKIIDAENSDLFDVLAQVAYALPPLTREERASKAKVEISTHFNSKQQVFLDFVLSHYVSIGVEELDQQKLTPLLRLKYGAIQDALADLGHRRKSAKRLWISRSIFTRIGWRRLGDSRFPRSFDETLGLASNGQVYSPGWLVFSVKIGDNAVTRCNMRQLTPLLRLREVRLAGKPCITTLQTHILMNLRFFTYLSLLCVSGFLCAAPYAPEGKEIVWTQPDGTILELRVFGDEFYARTETLGGHTVIFDESRMAYYYAKRGQAGDALEVTATPAHQAPPQGLEKHLELDNRRIAKIRSERVGADVMERNERWQNRMQSVRRLRNGELGAPFEASPARAAAEIQAAPVSGNMVGLTLIVQFPNDSATSANDPVNFPTNKEKIERYCNNPGYAEDGNSGSIRDYFYDQSLGKLTYTQKVSELVTLPRARNYYNFSDYPNNQTLRNPTQAGTLIIQDAIAKLRSQNFDFSGLTAGADNVALATNVFFAGRNSGVWARGLWPHQSRTSTLVDLGPSAGGMRLSQYQITDIPDSTPEIGTFCHENGHLILDFPDLYDYGGESGGIGRHGLMASGNYSNGGRTPSPINAHFKDIVGWANVRELAPAESVKVLLPSTGNEFVRIRKPGSNTEYFLFENRGQGDKWAQYVPDKGIAIWHIDEAVVGNDNQEMTATRHYQVSLEQADGLFQLERSNSNGDTNDLFDLTVPLFSGATVPGSRWWSGATSGVRARIESMPGSNMSVTFGDLPPNTLILNSPNGGEVLFRNSTLRIQWESNITGNVRLDLLRYGGLIRTIAGNITNTKRFDWIVPESLQIGDGYQVKISSLTNPVAVSDLSDLQFSITPATFPLGGKMPIGWQKPKGADNGWVLTNSGAYEGKYALMSNQLGDGETAAIQYRNKFRAGTISFYMKTSSEPNSDVARFYVNGKAQNLRGRTKSLSGLGGWVAVVIPISAGTHTLMWTYEKDDSYGDGKDAVWLDGVFFPLANPEIDVKSWKGESLASGIFSHQVGQVKVGAKPILRDLKISNLGEEYLGKLKASLRGDDRKDFKIRGLSRDVLSAGQSATLKIEFLPSKIGWKQVELVISSNDSDEGRFVVNLYGKALPKKKPKKKQKSGSKNLASSMADFSQATVADGDVRADVQRVIKNDERHLALSVRRDQIPEGFSARVEVSSDLLDWFSGPAHTIILNDNQHVYRVMDKTPITSGMKRYIRVRYIPHRGS